MIDTTMIQHRQPEREELQALTEQFLQAGNTITKVSHIERAPYTRISGETPFNRRAESRREFFELERRIADHGRALASIGLTSSQAMRQIRRANRQIKGITGPRLEQIAAKYGYAYEGSLRGRP